MPWALSAAERLRDIARLSRAASEEQDRITRALVDAGRLASVEGTRIAAALAHTELSPLLTIALVMVLVAFGFKAAAAPFHLWAPDAYEGAPTPSAALIASASKLAGFTLFLRLLWPGLGGMAGNPAHVLGQAGGWVTLVALLAGASLLLGNLAALAQTSLRRLLAAR